MAPDPRVPAFDAPARPNGVGPFSRRQLAIFAAVVIAVGGLLYAATRPIASTAPGVTGNAAPTQFLVGQVSQGLRVGDVAPELRARRSDGSTFSLTDLSGRPISLAALRGHPVWINFWASWCPPCQDETPVLRDVYASYKDRGLVLIAISVQESSAADVRAYASRYRLGYTIGADLAGDVFRAYRIYGLPTQFFLDSNGVIRSIVQGPVDYDLAVANLNAIVPGAPASSAGPPTAVPPTAVPTASPSR